MRRNLLLKIVLTFYMLSLFTLVFFPRPILETGDPTAIAEFLRTHTNYFYKVLYADSNEVSIANFFMLTPFVLLVRQVFPALKLTQIAFGGVATSITIELGQFLIPGRVSDLRDFFSNSVSVILGICILRIWSVISR